jgi:hypothetical protein
MIIFILFFFHFQKGDKCVLFITGCSFS